MLSIILLRLRRALHVLFVFALALPATPAGVVFAQSTAVHPGGFLEMATSGEIRPRLTAQQIQALLPQRGEFTFPAPWLTEGVRLTNSSDCAGSDCVNPVGYSYWRNINNHAGSDTILILIGLNEGRGGSGPTLFSYDKVTGVAANLGALFPAGSYLRGQTGEGWYFSGTAPAILYLHEGSRLRRMDVLSGQMSTVFDAAAQFGANRYIWQAHSSDDDRIHSATLRSLSTSEMLGCLVYDEPAARFSYYPSQGGFDECHVDKSGRWLLILDNVDGLFGLDNRIVDLTTSVETLLLDQAGALGHADLGFGYMAGEDDWGALPGTTRLWKFGQPYLAGLSQGLLVYNTTDWSVDAGHLAHGNARPGLPPEQQFMCSSNALRLDLPRANEIVCYRLDGSREVLVVAPVMTDLNASGGGDDYSKKPKGNLDVTGDYFIWTANMGGGRLDAFLVKVPSHLLIGGALDVTPPAISGASASSITSSGAVIVWSTDELADSLVEYGPTSSYGSGTPLDAGLVTSHSGSLGGLSPGTLYHFRVRSRDAAGNLAISADGTFTTLPVQGGGGGELKGHWRLDETSGVVASDASGNAMTGSLRNGPIWGAGRVNGALSFDGVNDYVAIPHNAIQNAFPFSIALWARASGGGIRGLVSKSSATSGDGYQIALRKGNICATYSASAQRHLEGGALCVPGGGGAYNDGRWHHVAFTVDDSGGKLYVDGVVRLSKPWSGASGPTTLLEEIRLGRHASSAQPYLQGSLDDVRLYGHALTAAEVASLHGAPGAGSASLEPVAWTSVVNCTAAAGTLTKVAGYEGVDDAGAVSQQQIASGDGYMEFMAPEAATLRFAGLSHGSSGTGYAEIDFAIRLRWGIADVRENGEWRADTTFVAGDRFRVAVESGLVRYYKNGALLHTSGAAPVLPLLVDASLLGLDGSIAEAVISRVP